MRKFCPNCEEGLKVNDRNPAMGHCNGCGWAGHLGMAAKEPKLPAVPPKLPYVSIDIETTGLDPATCQTLEIGAVIDDWTLPLDQLPMFRRVLAWEQVAGSPYAMALNADLLKFIGNQPKDREDVPQNALNIWMEKCAVPSLTDTFPVSAVLKLLGDEPIKWHEIPNMLLEIGRTYAVPEALKFGGNPPGISCFCYDYELPGLFASWLEAHGLNPRSVQAAGKNFAAFDMQFLYRLPQFNRHVNFRHRVLDPAILFWNPEDERLPDSKTCYERAGMDGKVSHTAVEDALAVVRLVRQGIKHLW